VVVVAVAADRQIAKLLASAYKQVVPVARVAAPLTPAAKFWKYNPVLTQAPAFKFQSVVAPATQAVQAVAPVHAAHEAGQAVQAPAAKKYPCEQTVQTVDDDPTKQPVPKAEHEPHMIHNRRHQSILW